MNQEEQQRIIEALIFASAEPMSISRLQAVFADDEKPDKKAMKMILSQIKSSYAERGIELKEVGTGYRFQVPQTYADWVSKLWEERPARYSRATLETLALIAYRQPITRTEIEQVRGVSVSSNIIKSLTERNWIQVVGHRDVPGKPALLATTKEFLDYFNLSSLEDLPPLAELRDIDAINQELDFMEPDTKKTAVDESNSNDGELKSSDAGATLEEQIEEQRQAAEPESESEIESQPEPLSAES